MKTKFGRAALAAVLFMGLCPASGIASESDMINKAGTRPRPAKTNAAYIPPAKYDSKGWHISESFEGAWPPAGWTVADLAVPETGWIQSDSSYQAHTGYHAAFISYTSSGAGPCNDWLITPQFTVMPNDSVYFWFRSDYIGWSPDDTYLKVSTTNAQPSSFLTTLWHLWEGGGYTQTFTEFAADLTAYSGQQVYLAFQNINDYGDGVIVDDVRVGHGSVGVEGAPVQTPETSFALLLNHPNPARGRTTISFNLPTAGTYELSVYNISGQKAAAFAGRGHAGPNSIEWNASRAGAGVYLYRLSAGGQSAIRKMTVIK